VILFLRFVAWLLLPLPLCLELLAVGSCLLWFSGRQRTGKVLVTAGALLLAVLGSGPVANLLLHPFESAYPPLLDPAAAGAGGEAIKWVVVLGGGYRTDPHVPLSARPSGTSLVRLVEGIRLHRQLPGSRLLVLVGEAGEGDERAGDVARLVSLLGVKEADLVVVQGARDTAQEADATASRVGADGFVLVTSASHMPRAVRLFEDRGLSPVPAPTDQRAAGVEYAVLDALPSAGNLGKSRLCFHEALGSAWRKVGSTFAGR
jgi:uncharacterized SAM-binding protein YcdF (DUF218 family)